MNVTDCIIAQYNLGMVLFVYAALIINMLMFRLIDESCIVLFDRGVFLQITFLPLFVIFMSPPLYSCK